MEIRNIKNIDLEDVKLIELEGSGRNWARRVVYNFNIDLPLIKTNYVYIFINKYKKNIKGNPRLPHMRCRVIVFPDNELIEFCKLLDSIFIHVNFNGYSYNSILQKNEKGEDIIKAVYTHKRKRAYKGLAKILIEARIASIDKYGNYSIVFMIRNINIKNN